MASDTLKSWFVASNDQKAVYMKDYNWNILHLNSAAKLAALSRDPENLKKLSLNAYLQIFATKMPYLQVFATG